MKKVIRLLLMTILFLPLNCFAATGLIDIYASNKALTIGNTFTVTVYCKSSSVIGTCEYTLSYDSSKIKFVSATDTVNCNGTYCAYYAGNKSSSKQFTFKAIANGSATISAKAYGMIDFDENSMDASVSPVTVTISKPVAAKPVTYSTNNNLSNLEVEGYKLNEKFNKDTTSYSVSVPSSVEKIKINAKKEDSTATINGTGDFNVSEGDNNFEVVVTSEKGTKKTYKIKVVVEDKNPIVVKIADEEYSVIKRKSNLTKPENYEEITSKINDIDIPAFKSEVTGYTLVGLKNSEGEINLYIYDNDKNTYTLFSELTFNTFKLNYLENNDVPVKELKKEEITINDNKVSAYKLTTNYYLVYGKNNETGKDDWYLYEKTQNTIQLFNKDYIKLQEEKLDKANELILIFSASTLLMAFLLLIVSIFKGKKTKKHKNKIGNDFLENNEIIELKEVKNKKNQNKKEKTKQREIDEAEKENIIVLDNKTDKDDTNKAKEASHESFKDI